MCFDEDADRDALSDVENVLVLRPIRSALSTIRVPVQIEHVDVSKRSQEARAHAAKRRVVEVGVICDECEYAAAGAINPPLAESDELDVVVLEPFGLCGFV